MNEVAKILIRNIKDEILVIRRSGTHPKWAYHLDFPGGDVEDNETPVIGVLREVTEEVGIIVYSEESELLNKKIINDYKVYYLFGVNLQQEPNIKLSWEHDLFKWISKEELINTPLPKNCDDYFEMVINYLKNE